MNRAEARAASFRLAASTGHGLAGVAGFLLLAAAYLFLGGCHPEVAPAEEKYVTVRLHDSLSKFDRVEVLILSAADTSRLVGRAWDGRLATPSSLPAYRLPDTETRPLAIRVRAYDSAGKLVYDQLITKVDGKQVVVSLLPPANPNPNPNPVKPAPSVRLSALTVFPGTLSPAFDSLKDDYMVSLPYEQGSIVLSATAVTDSATILIEGIPVVSGVATVPYDLHVGSNELGIRVTVGDSTGRYSLKVDRAQRIDPPDTSSPSDWDAVYKAWKYKAAVDVNVMNLGMGQGARVEAFPLVIKLTKEKFVFSQAGAGGRDLRFTRLGRPIDHEISRWDTAAGLAEVWVRLDTVRCDTAFAPLIMYWGNSTAASASNPEKVFPSSTGHSGVWHLSESGKGDAGEYKDATGRYHGRGSGSVAGRAPRRVEGVVGYGQSFKFGNANSAIELPRNFDPGWAQQWTFQCWVKTESSSKAVLFFKGNSWLASDQRFQIALEGAGQQVGVNREGGSYKTGIYLPRNYFVHIGIVYTGNQAKVFMDGFEREIISSWSQGSGADGNATIGAHNKEATIEPFNGVLDELWFSGKVRTAEWMRLSYENQKPYSYLVAVGQATAQKSSGLPALQEILDGLQDLGR